MMLLTGIFRAVAGIAVAALIVPSSPVRLPDTLGAGSQPSGCCLRYENRHLTCLSLLRPGENKGGTVAPKHPPENASADGFSRRQACTSISAASLDLRSRSSLPSFNWCLSAYSAHTPRPSLFLISPAAGVCQRQRGSHRITATATTSAAIWGPGITVERRVALAPQGLPRRATGSGLAGRDGLTGEGAAVSSGSLADSQCPWKQRSLQGYVRVYVCVCACACMCSNG